MLFRRLKWTLRDFIISTKRIKLYIQPPWGMQCRKFDLYLSYYPRPVDTISFGFTIPFVICFYFSMGVKFNWWGLNIAPQLTSASTGFWMFVGSKTASIGIRISSKVFNKTIDY